MHGGRYTGDPAYHKHIRKAANKMMEKSNMKPGDFAYFVPHQPNPTFPARIAKELGFKEEQYMPAIQMTKIGNTYSGAALIGLAAILDIAKPDEHILVTSYGSGAGSDSYILRTTKQITEKRSRQKINIKTLTENQYIEYIDYPTYRRLKQGM
jgi:hydroxymethylglutaryl-CoA synthase